jgi:hypothetical protein
VVSISLDGCEATSECVEVIIIELGENEASNQGLLYPNPTEEPFSLRLQQPSL